MNLEGSHSSMERQHQRKGKIILLGIATGRRAKDREWLGLGRRNYRQKYPSPSSKKVASTALASWERAAATVKAKRIIGILL
jgi:hypothetical protein